MHLFKPAATILFYNGEPLAKLSPVSCVLEQSSSTQLILLRAEKNPVLR